MAKKGRILVRLKSTESHWFYVINKKTSPQAEKLSFRKFDPVKRKHVLFKEIKINK